MVRVDVWSAVRQRVNLGWSLFVSLAIHVGIVLRVTYAGGLPIANVPAGEGGREGAGDITFEVVVAAERDEDRELGVSPLHTELGSGQQGEGEVEVDRADTTGEEHPESSQLLDTRSRREVRTPDARFHEGEQGSDATAASSDDPGSDVEIDVDGAGGAGTEAPITSGGASPGIDANQREVILGAVGALGGGIGRSVVVLSRATECEDPVAGTWESVKYRPEFREWTRFTLLIERERDALSGTILARTWYGLASDRRPPRTCTPEAWDFTVRMTARGRVEGDDISFGASTHHIARQDCPHPGFIYYPDRFTGRVDSIADRFHSVNNDGGRDINEPYEFRRVRCTTAGAPTDDGTR